MGYIIGLMNKIIKILFALGTLIAIIAVILVGVAYMFEDNIVKGVQHKINQNLDTKISVESVDFSMIEKFPYAAIKFNNVWIEDKLSPGDTLLHSEVLYLSFNMMDIISKKYVIKRAEIENGTINMTLDSDGSSNYIFWQENESESNSTVSFDIEDLKLENVNYRYLLGDNKFVLAGHVNQLKLAGNINEKGLELDTETSFDLHTLAYDNMPYLNAQKIDLKGVISLNDSYKSLIFNDFMLSIADISLPINGDISKKDSIWNVNLASKSSSEIKDILSVLSKEVKSQFAEYDLKGKLDFDAKLTGAVVDGKSPLLKANFYIRNGKIKELESGIALTKLNFKGVFQNLDKTGERLDIQSLTANLAGGSIALQGGIENFDSPWLNLHLNSNFNLSDLGKFLKLENINELSGNFNIDTDFKGPFPSKNIQMSSLDRLKMSGKMQVSDLNLKFKESMQEYTSLNGEVEFDDDDLIINKLNGAVNGSVFDANGKLKGFMHYIFDKQDKLHLAANIKSKHIDLDALLRDGGEESSESKFDLNNKIDIKLNADIDKLTYKNFSASNIKGKLIIKENSLSADNIKFNSAQGSVSGDLLVQAVANNQFLIASNMELHNADIIQLFEEFDQFGQDFINSSNLKGDVDANISYKSTMSESLDIDSESIVCLADVTIHNGELIQFQAMNEIYVALNDNKLMRSFLRLDELKTALNHVKFSTLKNKIEIRNSNINIPDMSIASNAMDINISGKHSFENIIDYHLNFRLSDILIRRDESEFGPIADDGTGMKLFIHMHGSTDDPIFAIDKEKTKESRKEEFIAEKKVFKSILKEELGLFKNHDTVDLPKKKTSEKAIITVVEHSEDTPSKTDELEVDEDIYSDDDDF